MLFLREDECIFFGNNAYTMCTLKLIGTITSDNCNEQPYSYIVRNQGIFFFNSIKLCKKSLGKYKISNQWPHISYKVAFLSHVFTDNTIVLDKYWNISIFSKYKQQIVIRIYIIILFHLKSIFGGPTLSLLENTAKTFHPLITPIYFPCL